MKENMWHFVSLPPLPSRFPLLIFDPSSLLQFHLCARVAFIFTKSGLCIYEKTCNDHFSVSVIFAQHGDLQFHPQTCRGYLFFPYNRVKFPFLSFYPLFLRMHICLWYVCWSCRHCELCHLGAGNQTWTLWDSCTCSYLWSHLFSPQIPFSLSLHLVMGIKAGSILWLL